LLLIVTNNCMIGQPIWGAQSSKYYTTNCDTILIVI